MHIAPAMRMLFKAAMQNRTFEINDGTYHKVYKHRHNPRLNRSRHWPFANTYQEARDMSPSIRIVR